MAGVFAEYFFQMLDVLREHGDADSFLGRVDCDGTDGETGHRCYVAGSSALGFDDEDATTRGGCRLFDGVAVAD